MLHYDKRFQLLILLFAVLFIHAGCSTDDPTSPEETGMVAIDTTPDTINAPWALTGPDGYSVTDMGDQILSNMAPGDYTVNWGDVIDWITPISETKTLIADGTVIFNGTYVRRTGTIEIDANPDALNASWTIAGPQDLSGNGDTTLTDMPTGVYTLTWGDVSDWIAPASSQGTLISDGTVTFSGTYLPAPYQWPDTPAKLIENFKQAYAEMNVDEYRNVLHLDYKFIFIDNAEIWTRDEDLRSTENMFAGNPGVDEEGNLRDGVQSITIDKLIQQTPWENVPPTDPDFPDSEQSLFEVRIIFTLEGGANTITVASDQQFYVISEEVDQGDQTTRTRYYLSGQRDLLSNRTVGSIEQLKNEDMSWGSVKSLYR